MSNKIVSLIFVLLSQTSFNLFSCESTIKENVIHKIKEAVHHQKADNNLLVEHSRGYKLSNGSFLIIFYDLVRGTSRQTMRLPNGKLKHLSSKEAVAILDNESKMVMLLKQRSELLKRMNQFK